MADFEKIYDSNATIPGHTIRLSDIIEGNCWRGMPAVIIESAESRYPESMAEYEIYGNKVPVLRDIEIGCERYQQLLGLPMPVEMIECASCPTRLIADS